MNFKLPENMIEKQRLVCGDIVVIRASSGPDTPNDNVFGIDKVGKILWRVEPVPVNSKDPNPFTNIYLNENGELMGYCWMGLHTKIDPQSGSIEVPSKQRPW